MVNSAIEWMKAGLPITCIKLVLYSETIQDDIRDKYKEAIARFTKRSEEERKLAASEVIMKSYSSILLNKIFDYLCMYFFINKMRCFYSYIYSLVQYFSLAFGIKAFAYQFENQ